MEAANERTTHLNACKAITIIQIATNSTTQSNVSWQKSLLFPIPLTEQVNGKCRRQLAKREL